MWFTENPWPPMLLSGIGALVALGFWASSKRAIPLFLSFACLLGAAVVYLVEQAILTPAEQVESQLIDLVDQFRRKNPAALQHFSRRAEDLRALCQRAMDIVDVDDDLQLSDIHTRLTNENSRAVTHFRAKGTVSIPSLMIARTYQPSRFELTWMREGDAWRIVAIRRLHPFKEGEELGLLESRPN